MMMLTRFHHIIWIGLLLLIVIHIQPIQSFHNTYHQVATVGSVSSIISKYQRTSIRCYGFGFSGKNKPLSQVDVDHNPCPCGSTNSYVDCCKKFHMGSMISTIPDQVVRSRFSAFVLGNISYILQTTHPSHEEYIPVGKTSKRKAWERSIKVFIDETQFISLVIDETTILHPNESTVSFRFRFKRKSSSSEYEQKETSTFRRGEDLSWQYSSGTGPRPNLLRTE